MSSFSKPSQATTQIHLWIIPNFEGSSVHRKCKQHICTYAFGSSQISVVNNIPPGNCVVNSGGGQFGNDTPCSCFAHIGPESAPKSPLLPYEWAWGVCIYVIGFQLQFVCLNSQSGKRQDGRRASQLALPCLNWLKFGLISACRT